MRRYAIRDDQWERIKDFLPGREGHVGGTAEDNRLFVDAAVYRFRAGVPWRDLPERFGDWNIVSIGPGGRLCPAARQALCQSPPWYSRLVERHVSVRTHAA